MISTIRKFVRKADYSIEDDELNEITNQIYNKIKNHEYDFGSYQKMVLSQGRKKRLVYTFPESSVEYVLCGIIKNEVDINFKIRFPNRNKMINRLFNTLPAVKNLNDFVIFRFDFKSFFDSVLTEEVYNIFIRDSKLKRTIKKIIKEYSKTFKFCYAGLSPSNSLTELICQQFDVRLRAKLEKYGVVFCERYVDDVLIILNDYITETDIRNILKEVIVSVFGECKIKLNEDKVFYISKRDIEETQEFDFLGYNFTLEYRDDSIKFKFGITEGKRRKYESKIIATLKDYKENNNLELLRHRLKTFSSRIVYTVTLNENVLDWVTKGIVSNYNELRFHLDSLDDDTEDFLKNIYFKKFDELQISYPYFISREDSESSYNLYSTMKRNKSIIFNEKIGLKRIELLQIINKLNNGYYTRNKSYYQIVMDYLDMLKMQ